MTRLLLGPIVGGLSDTSANLWGRADGSGTLRAWLGKKPDLSDAKPAGASLPLQPGDGFTGVAPVSGLKPETSYYYDLRLDDNRPPVQTDYAKFTTFPKPGQSKDFSFAFGSCFRPAHEGGGKIFASLENQRQALEANPAETLRFMLWIGDQVYSDDYDFNGLWTFNGGKKSIALTLDDYRNVYQFTWANNHHRTLLKNLPAFMTLDDHEVDDDWRWKEASRQQASLSIWTRFTRWLAGRPPEELGLTPERIRCALKAYWEHQGMHAPALLRPPSFDADGKYTLAQGDTGSLAYTFNYGAAAFFVMDTRTNRVKNTRMGRMLGKGQWQALKDWLLRVRDEYPVKFLVTSSSVLYSMFGDFLGDRWSGFRSERDQLLHFIGNNGIKNLYLIAGDLHSSHSMTAECGPHENPVLVHEFCSTPFEQVCNTYSRLLYTSIKTGAVHYPRRQFVVTVPNYAIVRVRFRGNTPQVDFELFDTNGQLLTR